MSGRSLEAPAGTELVVQTVETIDSRNAGGKGAAIGVLVAAAGGASAQVLTGGRDVQVPAETVLKFRLDKPVTLRA